MLQNKGKFLFWREYYNQFGIYQPSYVSLLEPWQSNLSNPEAYSKPCQTSKMECFAKIVNGSKLKNYFVKHSILDISQGSEYASVICYSLSGKTENANKIDSAPIKIYVF